MPMQSRTVDINLLPINQQTPNASAIPGQLKNAKNVQIKKFDGRKGPQLKVQKRNGFQQLTKEIRNVKTGLHESSAGFPAEPGLFASLNRENVIASGGHPYVLAEDEPAWSLFDYVYSPVKVRQNTFYTKNVQISAPDGASVGNVICRTWVESKPDSTGLIRGPMYAFTDEDGTPIRTPFYDPTLTTDARAVSKIASDGVRFWIATRIYNRMNMAVYDVHGVQLQSFDFAFYGGFTSEARQFDITFQQGFIVVAHPTATSDECFAISRFTWGGSSMTVNTFDVSFQIAGNAGVAWAENVSGDNKLYLMTAKFDPDGPVPIEHAYQIGSIATTPVVTHFFGIGNNTSSLVYDDDGDGPGQGLLFSMGGYWDGTGFFMQFGFLNGGSTTTFFGHAFSRTAMIRATLASALPPVVRILRSVVPSSRSFTLNGRQVALYYYPSGDPSVVVSNKRYVSQPTYFLIDLLTGQMVGEFNQGSAGMEWQRNSWPTSVDGFAYAPFGFCLGSVFADSNGKLHSCLAYQAQSVNETVFANDIVGNIIQLTAAIGYEDIVFGGNCTAIEYASELLMPGPLATSFNGYEFGENNVCLSPEQPTSSISTVSGDHLTLLGLYQHILVFERTVANGDRVRSGISVPVTTQLAGTQNEITLSLVPNYMTTWDDVIISVYRNIFDASTGAPSTLHYKVTDDLAPVYNDKGQITITFVDNVPDDTIAVNEVLYTDLGFVDRCPCPPFHTGCVIENRIVVAGLDNAIWISGEKQEGEAIWWTRDPAFRLAMPTGDEIQTMAPMDIRIGIQCRDSQWSVNGGGFPSSDGKTVNLQAPQRLPFNNGSTGFSALYPGGILYSSSVGNAWTFTRGLENKQLGAPVVDDFLNREVLGITIDVDQRIGFLLKPASSEPYAIEVFDQISGSWFQYLLPVTAKLLHRINGRMAFVAADSVWVQDPTSTWDIDVTSSKFPIPMSFETENIALNGIKDFCAIWDQIITGEYRGAANIKVTVTQDDNGQTEISEWQFSPFATGPFIYSLPPRIEECSRVSYKFEDTNIDTDGNGDSFALEVISLNAAIAPGLARIGIPNTIAPKTVTLNGTVTGSSDMVTVLRLNGGHQISILPGATTFSFTNIPVGTRFRVAVFSGPGTVVNGTGVMTDPQTDTPSLSL